MQDALAIFVFSGATQWHENLGEERGWSIDCMIDM
jgi:hypothetical protein